MQLSWPFPHGTGCPSPSPGFVVFLVFFSCTFHRAHRDCTPAAKPGFHTLLPPFSATQLPAFRFFLLLSEPPSGYSRLCPLLIQIHPSLPVSSSPLFFEEGRQGPSLTCLLQAPPPEIFPFRNPRAPSPDPSFAPIAADIIS